YPLRVKIRRGEVSTLWAVSATYQPFGQPAGLFFKKGMYVSYVLELQIPKDALKEGIYEDTQNPYHYFRVDSGSRHERMIVGGEDHLSEIPINTHKPLLVLRDYVRAHFGHLKYKIVREWSGPILEPVDGKAFIGKHKHPRVLYAFGFSGNGMTY